MIKKKFFKTVAVVATISALFSAGCGKKIDSSFTEAAKKDIEETKEQARELQKETKEVVSSINEKVEEITEKIIEKTQENAEEEAKEEEKPAPEEPAKVDSVSGITMEQVEQKSYTSAKDDMYAYALRHPEEAQSVTVLEYYGEDICKYEYEKMKEEYTFLPADFWTSYPYEMFANHTLYEECNVGYSSDAKSYEEIKNQYSGSQDSGGYVPGQHQHSILDDIPTGTGTTWENYNSGLGEANLQ